MKKVILLIIFMSVLSKVALLEDSFLEEDVLNEQIVNVGAEAVPSKHSANTLWYEWESELLRNVINSRYVKSAKPLNRYNEPVAVSIEMVIMKLDQIIERNQEIIVSGFLKMAWKDERLAWNKQQYGGIEWIVVPSSKIWLPDVALVNSPDMYSITRDYRFEAVVDNNGNAIWVPSGKLAARCEFDVTYFPFDNQTCYYRLESWSYPLHFLNITGKSLTTSPTHSTTDHQWHLTSTEVRNYVVSYEDGILNFSRIDFVLYLKRKPLYCLSCTILPFFILSFLHVYSYFLPVSDIYNRLSFAAACLISFSVLQVSISEQIPKSSLRLPVLVIYIDVVMVLIGSYIVETFLISHILDKTAYTCPTPCLWVIIVDIMGRIVLFPVETYHSKFRQLKVLLDSKQKQIDSSNKNCQCEGDSLDAEQQKPACERQRRLSEKQKQEIAMKRTLSQPCSYEQCPRYWKTSRILSSTVQSQFGDEESDVSAVSSCKSTNCRFKGIPRSTRAPFLYYNNAAYESNYSGDDSSVSFLRRNINNLRPKTWVPASSCRSCTNLATSLSKLRQDIAFLHELSEELAERQLRELSLEVWTGLFSVIDRYLFILSITAAIFTPALLFIILPPSFMSQFG